MQNNDAGKEKNQDDNYLLSYDDDASAENAFNSTVGRSDSLSTPSSDNSSPIQFGSRKERRKREQEYTQTMPQSNNHSYYGQFSNQFDNNAQNPALKSDYTPPSPKEYWGGTAMLVSLLIFIGAQIVAAIGIVVNISLNPGAYEKVMTGGTIAIQEALVATPLLLIFMMVIGQYLPWLGSMWWVAKYRSGVQRGKKFWAAFKDNFRLNDFKWVYAIWGVGIAAAMLGLQYFVLYILPAWFPSMQEEINAAGNAHMFAAIEGAWLYIIAFGIVGFLGPIVEELFFRGFLLRGFENTLSYKNVGRNMDVLEEGLDEQDLGLFVSILASYRAFTHQHRHMIAAIVTSILFGLIHYQGSLITCLFTGILGFVFALVTLKLNKLYPAIIAHVLYNSSLMFMMITSQS